MVVLLLVVVGCCWLVVRGCWLLVDGCWLLVVWLFGCLVVWLFGCLVVWLFGCWLVVVGGCWLMVVGCLVVWLFGCLVRHVVASKTIPQTQDLVEQKIGRAPPNNRSSKIPCLAKNQK